MQEAWTVRKTEEIQGYANRNEWKNFSTVIKPVHGLPTRATAPLFSADGSTVLTEKTQILQQMTEHFRGVLNRPSTTSDTAIARMPQVETNADLGLPPSLHETIRKQVRLPPSSWDHGHDLRRPPTAGELSGDATHLYSNFVDLTKTFDTVNREELWKIVQQFGCPERFSEMVRQLQDCMIARVTDNGAVSEAFAVTKGVKQGCVLAPALFSLMFSAMLIDAYRDERPGIRIAYRTDGQFLNHRRMHFQSRESPTTVH
ncbi:hypothetical protein SprV_0200765600 [Sparganum proliferum]